MKRPLKITLLLLSFFVRHFCWAQSTYNDSLKLAFNKAVHDTTRCKILSELVEADPNDSVWSIYNEKLRQLSELRTKDAPGELKNIYLKYYALALNNFGYLSMSRGETSKAYEYYYKALEIAKGINDKESIASELLNLGYLYRQDGNIFKALESYHEALKIQLEINNEEGVATSYNNIGFIFDAQGEYDKALEYYYKSLDMYSKIGDKDGIANCYGNIAFVYTTYGDPECKGRKKDCTLSSNIKAIEFLNKSIVLREETKEKTGLANSLNVLGGIYEYFGDPACTGSDTECKKRGKTKALEYYLKSLKVRQEIRNVSGIAQSYNSLAEHMYNQGVLNEALEYGLKCMDASKELGSPERIKDAAFILKKIYEKQNKYHESLGMYELYIQMRDSIYNEETKKNTIKKAFQIEYEKQTTRNSIENIAKINEERFKNEAAITKQRYYTYGGLFGFGLMLLVALISFRAFKNKQRANNLISQQKKAVEDQKHIIEKQKAVVDTKQKEIVQSITYAKRLQDAILPPRDFINKHLPNNFILYKPKDIVAGDFYWAEKINDLFFIAAADSTGHGVPGAMVSVVCSNALNRTLKEFYLTDPGKILDKTRELVLETFEKSTDEVKDGMDISLLCIDRKNQKICWSGANNPLWYIQNNEFKEIKADKQSIGQTDYPHPFTTHHIDFAENTTFYLFTDGFADQFGGEHGKKFKYKQMSELLFKNNHLLPSEQKEILSNTFETWKGELEQVDDVCIIGIRL